jgi:2-oxo-4-hydroxy-4-carboxy-5-ureidoimidazoline decarboxylase
MEAEEALRACCAATAWVDAVVAARPYPSRSALLEHSTNVLDGLDWAGIREALDAHPRIGERAGQPGREAKWSATEQSGMDSATADVKAALVEANRAYEQRFGHVFLIFATGKTDTEMLAAAQRRVNNEDVSEQTIVREELLKIVSLRLAKLLDTKLLDTDS